MTNNENTLGPEHLAPLLEVNSPREIMRLYSAGAEDRFTAGMNKALTRFQTNNLTRKEFIEVSRRLAEQRNKELPFRDSLTGAYGRKDLYTFLDICYELGHDGIIATIFDMDYLKDYNINLGEPSGGDFALALTANIAEAIAAEKNNILFRYQGEGGDDFIMIGFQDGGDDSEEVGRQLEKQMAGITQEEFFNGEIKGKKIVRYKGDIPLKLDDELVRRLKSEKPSLIPILIPPRIAYKTVQIDPQVDVTVRGDTVSGEFYDHDIVAAKIEGGLAALKDIKSAKYSQLAIVYPDGVNFLSRSPK